MEELAKSYYANSFAGWVARQFLDWHCSWFRR
jgi:hypothetical protein